MVVAGRNMDITADTVFFLPDHQPQFDVGLQTFHAIYNVGAGIFQRFTPGNIGLLVKALYDLIATKRLARRYLWFFAAFAATAVVCFALSLTTNGVETWQGFFENMSVHNERSAGFRIGFKHMFMMDGNLTGPDGFVFWEQKAAAFASRQTLYWICVAAFLAPLALVIRRASDITFSIVFFLLAFFLLAAATRYYYSVLVLALLLDYDLLRERWYAGVWLLAFLMSTYEAAATGANWERAALECAMGVPGRPRRI